MNNSFLECAGSESILHKLYPDGVHVVSSEDDRYGYNIAQSFLPLLVYVRDHNNIPLDINKLIGYLSHNSLRTLVELRALPDDLKLGLSTYLSLLDEHTIPIHNRGVYNIYFRSIKFLKNLSDVSVSMLQPEIQRPIEPSFESVLSKAKSIFINNNLINNDSLLKYTVQSTDFDNQLFFVRALEESVQYKHDIRKYSLNIVRVFMRTALQCAAKEAHKLFMGAHTGHVIETCDNTNKTDIGWEVLNKNLNLKPYLAGYFQAPGQKEVCSICGFDTRDSIGNLDCCVLCHESLHSVSAKGYMLWLPELTQAEVNWISRWLSSIAIYKQPEVASHVKSVLQNWMSFFAYRRMIVDDLFGSSDANVLYQAGWRDHLAIQGMRYFTFVGDNVDDWDYPNRFNSAVGAWTKTLSSMVSEPGKVTPFLNSET